MAGGGGNGGMREVRWSGGRRKCKNTGVLLSFTSTPPGKSHFLRSTRNRPADVDVLLPSPLLLTLWHFSDLTADLLNVFRLCPSVCLSVCLCTTLYPLWVLGVGMAGSRGVIRTNCLCRAASQSALTPLSVPVLGRHSHLLALLFKPEQPVTQGFGWTGDVPYL